MPVFGIIDFRAALYLYLLRFVLYLFFDKTKLIKSVICLLSYYSNSFFFIYYLQKYEIVFFKGKIF